MGAWYNTFPASGTSTDTAPVGGLAAGTLLDTERGWTPVEDLRSGAKVYTLDGGLRPIRSITRRLLDPGSDGANTLVSIPGGALGNCATVDVLAWQEIMIESAFAERLLETPIVMLPAFAMQGYRGIAQKSVTQPLEAFDVGFEDEEVVFANSGLRVWCAGASGSGHAGSFFPRLTPPQARAVLHFGAEAASQLSAA